MTPPSIEQFRRLIGPFQRAIRLMIGRGIVNLSDDTGPLQTVQIQTIAGQALDGVQVVGQYGFASRMKTGAEVVHASIAGVRAHQVVIAVADRRYRLTGLAEGEVALHDDQGKKVYLTRDGMVLDGGGKTIKITNTPSVRIEADLHVTGDIKDQCDGSGQTMVAMRSFDVSHHHGGVQTGTGESGSSVESY